MRFQTGFNREKEVRREMGMKKKGKRRKKISKTVVGREMKVRDQRGVVEGNGRR